MLRSINDTSETTRVIPKVKELKETIKFFDGCIWNTDRMFIVYTLHACRISLRKREQVFKEFRFSDQEIAMDFIYLLFYLYSSGLLVG